MAGLSSPGLGIGTGHQWSGRRSSWPPKRAPRQAQITRAQTSTVTTISALGQLKGALGAFQTRLARSFRRSTLFHGALRHLVRQPEIFTATATRARAAGSYDIEVCSLASAHQISSQGFASGSGARVGTGTLTIAVGDQALSRSAIRTSRTRRSRGIRDAINYGDRQQQPRARHDRQRQRRRAPGADGPGDRRDRTRSRWRRRAATAGSPRLELQPDAAPRNYTQPRAGGGRQVNVSGFTQHSDTEHDHGRHRRRHAHAARGGRRAKPTR